MKRTLKSFFVTNKLNEKLQAYKHTNTPSNTPKNQHTHTHTFMIKCRIHFEMGGEKTF